MSNSKVLAVIRTECGIIDVRLAAIERAVPSDAARQIGRARAYLRLAGETLAAAIEQSADPIPDLREGQVA